MSIYVILDNAAYQRCKKVKDCTAELNINLIYTIIYSKIQLVKKNQSTQNDKKAENEAHRKKIYVQKLRTS